MKPWKKILLATGAALVTVLLVLALLPFLFRERITERVKAAINESVDAHVDFGTVRLTFFRDFPDLTFSLNELSVVGAGAFAGDTLAHVPRLRLVFDLGSVVRAYRRDDELLVRSITIERPYLHARVLADGTANWDILKDDDAKDDDAATVAPDAEPARFRVALRKLAVTDARVLYDDAHASLSAVLNGLDHTLAGDFTQDRFTLRTETQVGHASVRQLGVPYLNGVRVALRADVDADMATQRFTFRDNELRLNELALAFDGAVALRGDDVDLDLTFAAARADFRELLSLVPAVYLQDFHTLQTSGTVAVNGHVRGTYGANDFPALALNMNVADGMFRYPDLPLPARNIFVSAAITNPGGDADSTLIKVERFDITFGEDPFHATVTIAHPISDPDVDLALNGRIDLGGLGRTVKLDGIDELRGVVTTDAAVRTRLSWLEAERFERVVARGSIEADNLFVRGDELPYPVEIDELRIQLAPSYAELNAFSAQVGTSDFRATGRLDNLLGFALRGQELRGRAALASNYISLDEWQSDDELEVIPVPANLDLVLAATIGRMRLGDIEMTDALGSVRVKDQRITLENFSLRALDGELVMGGWYETKDVSRPAFDFDIAMRDVDVRSAFTTLNTVRALAPAAGYASGRFSADLRMGGVLGAGMAPELNVLSGRGTVSTAGIALQGMPMLHRIAETVRVDRLRDPGLADFIASIEVRDGRLHVRPFDVGIGGSTMSVAGSNGIDQSLDYRLVLEMPRGELGADANRFVAGLLTQAGRTGVDLDAAAAVRLNATVGGSMTSPTVRMDFGETVGTASDVVREQLERRARAEADRRVEDVERRAAEAREQARARAAAQGDSIMAEAELRAAAIRAEAEQLAASVRREGHAQADRLLAEATSPVARQAARPAADRIRREADERAAQIVREADRRTEELLAEARRRADALAADAS